MHTRAAMDGGRQSAAARASEIAGTCMHCGSSLATGAADAYCCHGCRAVATLIAEAGLGRYYELGGGAGAPVALSDRPRDRQWLEPIATALEQASSPTRIELDVQGMHCAGCVWLSDELFLRRPGAIEIIANPALGRYSLWVEPTFDLRGFVSEIEAFGYRLGPALKEPAHARDALLARVGVAVALAANAMMFALAIYLGLREGALYEVMRALELVLAIAAVAVGLPVFARGAIEGLRRGMLHLDVPIALGMLLALAGTIASYLAGASAHYADTVAIFVALMLLGRWLQARAVAHNRDRLLRSNGAEDLLARRIEDGALAVVRAKQITRSDRIVIAPGEVAVVDATLESDARVALDWINGESDPKHLSRGEALLAGSVNVGSSAIVARAVTSFADSPLESLLGRPIPDRAESTRSARFWDRAVRVYIAGVLLAAGAGGLFWGVVLGEPIRGLEVATAILVVTCPCGIGIATPLAYELATTALRRRGLFVRRERTLDRAADITAVVFDKTGTLTTGRLELATPDALDRLGVEDRTLLGALAARSSHPKSEAIRDALGTTAWIEELEAIEEPGRGVRAWCGGHGLRLGAPEWAAPLHPSTADVVFARDGVPVIALSMREVLRADAAEELRALEARGLAVAILSGDEHSKVQAIARRLGVAPERALSAMSPEDKASWLRSRGDRPILYVGDGINDSPAFEVAALAGTPSIDRPQLPGKADFFFVTSGLAPVRALLDAARAVRRVAARNLVIAVTYNLFAVSLSLGGLMEPWLAAILMPASSIFVISATVRSLRDDRWSRQPADAPDRPAPALLYTLATTQGATTEMATTQGAR